MWTVISVNWTAQALTGEQMLVLRNVAARHLRLRKKSAELNFRHELCEGTIKREREGTFGTFSGTFFHADLGTVKGERWTCDFLLPRGTEELYVDDDSIVLSVKPLSMHKLEASVVDVKKASIGADVKGSATVRSHAVH